MSSPNSNAPSRKKGKSNKLSANLLRDLRGAGAFLSYSHINRMPAMQVKEQENEMVRQFWGDNASDTASVSKKPMNGEEAFKNMCKMITTEEDSVCVLKKQCTG